MINLLVILTAFALVVGMRTPNTEVLASFGSLVYSSIFPFTVSLGKSRQYHSTFGTLEYCFAIACVTVWLSLFNPVIQNVLLWAPLILLFDRNLYLPILLYLTTFAAISKAALTSFNFEETSLISQAVSHTLLYVAQQSMLAPHEIFLPALTFGMMVSIAPTIPLLRKLESSSKPRVMALSIYAIVVLCILLVVRPWLVSRLSTDPIPWVFDYMTSSKGSTLRIAIVIWWIAVLAFGIIIPVKFFTNTSEVEDNGDSLNKRRKFFHGIVVLLFLPALNLDVFLLVSVLQDKLME